MPLAQGRFVWLASWPRSGNTWLRLLISSLLNGGGAVDIGSTGLRTPVASRAEFDEYFGIDSSSLTPDEIEAARPALHETIARHFDGPLILRKVHDRCWRTAGGLPVFPPELSRGAVYIARDPRDVAVSYADFFDITIDEAIGRMGDSGTTLCASRRKGDPQLPQPLGAWSEHVASWLDESGMPVHLLRYEDLAAETAARLAEAAKFLGLAAETAAQAAEAVTFNKLRRQEEEKGFRERPAKCAHFFRRGQAGGWREVLSRTQSDRLERDHGAVMSRLGYL